MKLGHELWMLVKEAWLGPFRNNMPGLNEIEMESIGLDKAFYVHIKLQPHLN